MTKVDPLPYARPPAPPVVRRRDSLALAALTAGTAVLAGVLLWRGLTTWLEAVSFVTGGACVWLTVRESVWNFPIGMANVAAFFVVFLRAKLYADAGLQIVYFALGGIGWYLWLFGGAGRTPLRITRTPPLRAVAVGVTMLWLWVGLWGLLRYLNGGSPGWDALTTAISLGAQWLLDRKHLESWLLWIAADVIYVPLYLSKGLYLTSALYAVFLGMAVVGLFGWRRAWLDLRGADA